MEYLNTYRGELMTKTLELLNKCEKPLHQIYAETHLPFHWLKKFHSEEFENPSVNRVQFLYEYLSGKKITLN